MFGWLYRIRPSAWALLTTVIVLPLIPVLFRTTKVISPEIYLYVLLPLAALSVAGISYMYARGHKDRVRHRFDKSLTVGSVFVIWFVIYFMSGLAVTYTYNALTSSILAVILNVIIYGAVAAAFEYARHSVMLLAGRRNIMGFGFIVSLVFALQQMNLVGLLGVNELGDLIKIGVADTIPMIILSFLLTYLSITAGFGSQLMLRLGLVAATVLPPIIPKYDWYMTGVSLLLLAIAVYIVMDQTREHAGDTRTHRTRQHHSRMAFDIMFTLLMVGLVLFMTGALSYRPRAIVSNSMKPIFERGAIVIVQKVSPMDVSIGDIVQYEVPGRSITHRVMKIRESDDGSGKRIFITKGDNNPSPDPPVREDQVVGIIRAEIPYVGYPSVWLNEAIHEST